MSSPFSGSYQLPICFKWYIPKPTNDPIDKNCIIIGTHYKENQTTEGIYKYDMITNELQMIYKYGNTFKPKYHDQFIDISNNTLIFEGSEPPSPHVKLRK
eukprot:238400_1